MRDGTGKKAGLHDKTEENHFHSFVELLLEHLTVNETGAFGIPPDKGNRGQHFVYTLAFHKQRASSPGMLKVHQCRVGNLRICFYLYKNNTLKISHPSS